MAASRLTRCVIMFGSYSWLGLGKRPAFAELYTTMFQGPSESPPNPLILTRTKSLPDGPRRDPPQRNPSTTKRLESRIPWASYA